MKKTYPNVTLDCTFQTPDNSQPSLPIEEGQCLNGVISKITGGFRFEEAVKSRRPKRNPKLFDGNYCSLVHMQNGKYQIHMKTINASDITNCQYLAFKVYSELLNAFNIID